MNCFMCLVETGCASHPAFAICQKCGVGICEKHLVELITPPLVGLGASNSGAYQYNMVCCRCYKPIAPIVRRLSPQPHMRKQDKPGWNWWNLLRRHRRSELPNSEDAVATVEIFLKRQRKQ